jgi:predicted flap endonuclease-1-like 5' DNA nuclease
MSYSLMEIEGIGPSMAAKLKKLGIRTTSKLLENAKTAKQRKALAAKLDIDERVLLRWVTLADRMRIKGVGEPYAELLHSAGVDTVKELKHRNIANLAAKLRETNERLKLVRQPPSARRLAKWKELAKRLPPVITY